MKYIKTSEYEILQYSTISNLCELDQEQYKKFQCDKNKVECDACSLEFDSRKFIRCPLCEARDDILELKNELQIIKNEILQLKNIKGTVDNRTNIEEIVSSHASLNTTYNVGDILKFGSFDWQILKLEDNRCLLIAKECLEKLSYNTKDASVTWETSSLRKYLNTIFYDKNFSSEEKERILETELINNDNPTYPTSGGNVTRDKVFLLSLDEVYEYFSSDNERIATLNGKSFWWWLRSPGFIDRSAAIVGRDGSVFDRGLIVTYDRGVRPALWISID